MGACNDEATQPGSSSVRLTQVASLNSALYVTAPPGDTLRIFVVQQNGAIRVLRHDSLLTTPFLDLSGIISTGEERGLLSMAFHPNYTSNGFFYVDYTDAYGDIAVARYHVSTDPNVADPTSGQIILSIAHPTQANHNGGLVTFGSDGYLYIGTGDGGNDAIDRHAQDSTALLGKILRIDVNGAFPYAIPPSNPFVGRAPAAPEVWAYGLRNPWRFSFDRLTRDLYLGDVGELTWEEIDFALAPDPGGHNYGWSTLEGAHCNSPPTGCVTTGKVAPVYEYSHASGGCSITGGYVYRGTLNPSISGRYFFADFCAGWIRSLKMVGGLATDVREHTEFGTLGTISSFGEDGRGELYITRSSGEVYRITPQ